MLTSEVLYGAADLIQSRGLYKSGKPGTSGGLCTVLAIERVAKDEDGRNAAVDAVIRHIGLDTWSFTPVFQWNDAPERTQDEVIATLRAAAVIEAAKEETREVVTA